MTKARDLANIGTTLATVSTTELGYLDGVTSAIQTQIDGKQAANAAVSTTELGYLDGVTSAIQTQLDGKSGTSHNHDSTYIAKTLTTTTGDMIYASSANTPARLAIGSSSQVLTVSGGVPTWATPAGGGKVLQVVQATYGTEVCTSSTGYTDTGLSCSITPSSASSKVLILINQSNPYKNDASTDRAIKLKLLRNSTDIYTIGQGILFNATAKPFYGPPIAGAYLDSPNTTSSITYKTQFGGNDSGSNVCVQANSNSTSTMILMEIGA